ncbi:MAG TPA: SDR family oxidoreductase [Marinagarivorans sp.]|nr:SDR family oxidoreductase [Cellvibrionaceae bacterium]HMY38324.1 SDR family oxidoreductase [Marinagarivorans sp.]HNG61301.1 SDR family oxidoreductase [Cellvibrionaceae bacterium]
MIQFDFTGQRVLVVGGTSGINRGIARAFAQHGAHVAVVSRSEEKVQDTLAELSQFGNEVAGFTADVREYAPLSEGIKELAEAWGPLHVVVSGAAGNFPALGAQMSPNAFASVVNIDLLGTYHVMRAVYPYLQRPGASVLNISAPQAQLPMLAQAHVCAAKAGVEMLTRSLACEWGGEGLRVNAIIPGPIANTEGMARLAPTPELMAACAQSVPMGRLGEVEDIANAALLLASPLANFITGAIVPVDGGWLQGGAAAVAASFASLLKK